MHDKFQQSLEINLNKMLILIWNSKLKKKKKDAEMNTKRTWRFISENMVNRQNKNMYEKDQQPL